MKMVKITHKIGNFSGLAQIPILIGLVIMAVAIPIATNLVQKVQENRSKAVGKNVTVGTGEKTCLTTNVVYECTNSSGCSSNSTTGWGIYDDCGKNGQLCQEKQTSGKYEAECGPNETKECSVSREKPAGCSCFWVGEDACASRICISYGIGFFTHCGEKKKDGDSCKVKENCTSGICNSHKKCGKIAEGDSCTVNGSNCRDNGGCDTDECETGFCFNGSCIYKGCKNADGANRTLNSTWCGKGNSGTELLKATCYAPNSTKYESCPTGQECRDGVGCVAKTANTYFLRNCNGTTGQYSCKDVTSDMNLKMKTVSEGSAKAVIIASYGSGYTIINGSKADCEKNDGKCTKTNMTGCGNGHADGSFWCEGGNYMKCSGTTALIEHTGGCKDDCASLLGGRCGTEASCTGNNEIVTDHCPNFYGDYTCCKPKASVDAGAGDITNKCPTSGTAGYGIGLAGCYSTKVGSPAAIPSSCNGYDSHYPGYKYTNVGACDNSSLCCKKDCATGFHQSGDACVKDVVTTNDDSLCIAKNGDAMCWDGWISKANGADCYISKKGNETINKSGKIQTGLCTKSGYECCVPNGSGTTKIDGVCDPVVSLDSTPTTATGCDKGEIANIAENKTETPSGVGTPSGWTWTCKGSGTGAANAECFALKKCGTGYHAVGTTCVADASTDACKYPGVGNYGKCTNGANCGSETCFCWVSTVDVGVISNTGDLDVRKCVEINKCTGPNGRCEDGTACNQTNSKGEKCVCTSKNGNDNFIDVRTDRSCSLAGAEVPCSDRCSNNYGCMKTGAYTGLGDCDRPKTTPNYYAVAESVCGKKNGAGGGNDNACSGTCTPCSDSTLAKGRNLGNFNCSGVVDAQDFLDWKAEYIIGDQKNKKEVKNNWKGDADCNGLVNLTDLDIWLRNRSL